MITLPISIVMNKNRKPSLWPQISNPTWHLLPQKTLMASVCFFVHEIFLCITYNYFILLKGFTTLHSCIWQTLLSKVQFYSVFVFLGHLTHYLCATTATLPQNNSQICSTCWINSSDPSQLMHNVLKLRYMAANISCNLIRDLFMMLHNYLK